MSINSDRNQRPPATGKPKGGILGDIARNRTLLLMIAPALVYFVILRYLPLVGNILAFKRFNYVDGLWGSPWIGLGNFDFLVKSGALFRITRNTILYNAAFLLIGTITEIAVAIAISELASKSFKKIAQTCLFLPYFVSYVLVGAFVYNLCNFEFGTINSFLKWVGLEPIDLYGNVGAWKYIILAFHEWKGIGYGTVIYLAAITGIDSELYEAARIDGASIWGQIRRITVPLLKPTVVIITLFAIGKIMRGQFELFYQIIGENGHLFDQTDIIDTYVFRSLTRMFDVGMGTAVGLYQSFFGFLLVLGANWAVKKFNDEYALF